MNKTGKVGMVIAAAIGAVLITGTTALATTPVHAGTGWGVTPAPSATTNSTAATNPSWGTTRPVVALYGDSILYESMQAIQQAVGQRAIVQFHAFGGTNICDWLPYMRSDAQAHPTRVILAFGGNWPRPCDHSTDRDTEYRDDAITAEQIFAAVGAPVTLVNGPQASSTSTVNPHYGDTGLDLAYQQAAASVPGTSVDTAPARSVTPGHQFYQYLACLPGETAAMGCLPYYGGVIDVRAPDGVHLCPSTTPGAQPGICSVYSSGEVRYGRAMAQTVVTGT